MEGINLLLLVSRWLHLGAAIVAIGGVVFQRFVLMPGAAGALEDAEHQRLREAVGRRWVRFVHVCIAVLVVTGAVNFLILALPPKVEPMPYHAIFGVKFLAALAVFFVASALVGRAAGFEGMRRHSSRWLGVIILLAALNVLLSGVLNQVRTSGKKPPTPINSVSTAETMISRYCRAPRRSGFRNDWPSQRLKLEAASGDGMPCFSRKVTERLPTGLGTVEQAHVL